MADRALDPEALRALANLAAPSPVEGPPPRVVVPDLLGPVASGAILATVAQQPDRFVENEQPGLGYRHGWVAMSLPEATAPIAEAVWARLGSLVEQLRVDVGDADPVDVLEMAEVAVTAHLDGDFLAVHRDDGRPSRPNGRALSFVYWLHRAPRRFTGGQLRLCSWVRHEDHLVPGAPAIDLEPDHDTLVVFPSSTMHEILPIRAPGVALVDGRLAVTGFLRRAEVGAGRAEE